MKPILLPRLDSVEARPRRRGSWSAKLFGRDRRPNARLAAGRRVYAIGDVHGRLDLLKGLLDEIRADDGRRGGGVATVIVLLGDLIDRGPDSAGVVRCVMAGCAAGYEGWATTTVALMGNHEAAMVDALDGDRAMLRLWMAQGGDAALLSWGVDRQVIEMGAAARIVEQAFAAIPSSVRAWIADRPLAYRCGDYHFVHAGVRPGVPLAAQSRRDALWIRDPFLSSTRDHGAVIVHGHSITGEVDEHPNRIGIDTGAHATGRLTALGLEGEARWTLST